MAQFSDDIYMGPPAQAGVLPIFSASDNPTAQSGAGPMGRIAFLNIVPLTKQPDNAAALQHMTASTALTLTAGTGATSTTAPDGSGRTVIAFDLARSASLTSTANLSAINFTITGFDQYGRLTTQTRAGPNNTTVNTLKAFKSILSIVPDTTDGANNVSAGSSDVLGLPYAITDAVYVTSVKWAATLAADAGTFVVADATSPATASTGDPRGTYVPSSATNGSRRLVLAMHLIGSQVGAASTVAGLIGVTPV